MASPDAESNVNIEHVRRRLRAAGLTSGEDAIESGGDSDIESTSSDETITPERYQEWLRISRGGLDLSNRQRKLQSPFRRAVHVTITPFPLPVDFPLRHEPTHSFTTQSTLFSYSPNEHTFLAEPVDTSHSPCLLFSRECCLRG